MSDTAILKFEKRVSRSKGANNELRNKGYLLGNIIEKGMDSVSIAVKKDEFRRTLNNFGRNAIFTLKDGDDSYTAMVKELQLKPIVNDFQHVDFQVVSLTQEITANVFINILGLESLESKRLIVNRHLDIIPVIGFPQDIPDAIDIDVSNFNVGDSVNIGDLTLDKITADLDMDELVLSVSEPKMEVEETDDEEETDVEVPIISEEDSE